MVGARGISVSTISSSHDRNYTSPSSDAFKEDEYIRRKPARSVLSLPLMRQGKLVALLYLENNLAPRVFTPARVAILKFLASEAATSLENARLYHALRERESRIHRLVDANIIGICFFGPGGDILEANHAFLKTVGYDREDVSTGRLRWTNLTPPEWNDAPRTPMQSWKRLALSSRSKKSTSAKMAAALRY